MCNRITWSILLYISNRSVFFLLHISFCLPLCHFSRVQYMYTHLFTNSSNSTNPYKTEDPSVQFVVSLKFASYMLRDILCSMIFSTIWRLFKIVGKSLHYDWSPYSQISAGISCIAQWHCEMLTNICFSLKIDINNHSSHRSDRGCICFAVSLNDKLQIMSVK